MNLLKSITKTVIPPQYRTSLWNRYQQYRQYKKEMQAVWQGFKYAGDRLICPCCNGHFREFLPYGSPARPNAVCPRCYSLERHRLLWLYFQNQTNLFSHPLKILHIAPEKWLQTKFKTLSNLDYLSADLEADWAMQKMDITNILYENNTFDVILCNHVLEHIPDDRKAMAELLRVLKPKGWAILQVPLEPNRETTFEDPTITLPEERERIFGQHDHVRIYGRDYQDRLKQAGFQVKVDSYVKELSQEMIEQYALREDHDIYFCFKPE